jgi:phage terminase large subunit
LYGLREQQQLNTELVRQQHKRTVGSQLIQLVGKDEMRANKIPSPNMADALMMCFMWCATSERSPPRLRPLMAPPFRRGR